MIKEDKLIVKNKKAYLNYEVITTYEAGMVLLGSEVKSLRQGRVSLIDSYAHIKNGEIFLKNLHISIYENAGNLNHEPLRERKLLLHRREIRKLIGKVAERGFTLIPLTLFFKNGLVKVLLGLCKGKQSHDRRKDIKEKDLMRDMEREFKNRGY